MSHEEDGRDVDMRMLGLLDLADEKGFKLSLQSMVKVMDEGYTIEDFLAGDEEQLSTVRANTRSSILKLLDSIVSDDIDRLKELKSLYRLALTDGGISEKTVKNLLRPTGLSYEQLEEIDYETFKRLTGGGERHSTFAKLTRSFQTDYGAWKVTSSKKATRPHKIGSRQLKQIEENLTILYDEMADYSTLHGWAASAGIEEDETRAGLEGLIRKGLLELEDERVVKRTRNLRDALEAVSEVHRTILGQRLSGMTLQEVGRTHGITRERVRQIVQKALTGIPLTHVIEARRVRYLYENYDLDAEFFESVLLESRQIFHYLFEKREKGTVEKRLVYPLLRLDERKRMLLREGLYENLEGQAAPLTKSGLVEKYYALEGREMEHVSIHHRRYLSFIEEILRDREGDLEAFRISERAFEGLSDRIEGCIQSAGHHVRYLDIKPILEEREAIETFFVLDPGIYNARLVYDAHSDYFRMLDIRTYHELHNILKDNLKIETIQMRRMPEFSVMVTDKLEWLISLIDEMGPIPLETFLLRVEEVYGLSISSTRSLIQMELSDYITAKNELANDIPELSEMEEEFIRSVLVRDVYTAQELIERYAIKITDFQHRYLNKRNLSLVGYDLRRGFVLRKGIDSGEGYFRRLLLSEDYFRWDRSPLQNTPSFWKTLLDLQESLDLFRIEEDVYMNISVLERAGIAKEMVAEFREEVGNHFSDGRYYTMKNIHEEIEHPILDLGFEDVFYERICRSDVKARFIPTPSGDVLYQADERRNQANFIGHSVTDGIHIDELLASIEQEHGIRFEKWRVIEKMNSLGMYYMHEMERIYLDKRSFLDSIY
ncbi:sigma factor-like helix-turn-helix DNA-binding protein [Exiguobacterium sp. R-17]|uniref:sigma factor-like helix-turn-helix DNA-binding protein n=1 Tax=Exiguobacterium sp. R-17 TaxID=3404054 RepID=UPI003CEB151B